MTTVATITNKVYNVTMRDKNNWNLVNFNCLNCGNVVKAFPSRNVKYCSDCSKDRKVEIVCEYCGTKELKHASRAAKFCSRKCWIKSRKGHEVKPETRAKISSTKLAMPLTNPMSSRRRASKYLYPTPEPCEICGIDNPKRIDRHHKDRDPFNNDRANIQFLCKLHHQRIHKNWQYRKAWKKKNAKT